MAPRKKRPNTPKNPGGRPTRLTRELIDKVVGYLRIGNYVETAFSACGVPKASFYEWMKKGRLRRGTLYSALADSIDQAVAEGEVRDVMLIERAASGIKAEYLTKKDANGIEVLVYDEDGKPIQVRPGMKPDWKAAAWRAERRHPERWGRSAVVAELESIFNPSLVAPEDKVVVDPLSIKATLAKIRSEY